MSGILTALTSDHRRAVRIAESAQAAAGVITLARFHEWFAERRKGDVSRVERVPLDALDRWGTDPATGDIRHDSGRFFTVTGLAAEVAGAAVPAWTQPILLQPEIGILGILAKEIDGVLHFLMQAKNEPGNPGGVEISPTVQATRSNYTRVHQGAPVPYLDFFRDTRRHHVVADVLQSEQGAWFFQKRNRNIIVETTDEVEPLEGFVWLTLGQLHALLAGDTVVNMDARTVLSCLPFSGVGLSSSYPSPSPSRALGDEEFRQSVLRSCSEEFAGLHDIGDILSWITGTRSGHEVGARRVPLREAELWHRDEEAIRHESGLFFRVIGVEVESGHREVARWSQPLVEPIGVGVNAFVVKRVDGVLHALVHAGVQPGYLDVLELGPTVRCTPGNYAWLPEAARPPFLDEVLAAPPERIRFSSVLSEEGGRFYGARNRYLIVEADADHAPDPGPDYRWLTLHQLVGLLRHSHYVNVEARSLVACLHSLAGRPA
ncbi:MULTISPECIES: NDP-hexose 2,3-dehydratase family protein [Actinomadura]|uniref:NDP-hexose 2,3-dehydratase n=1 Tax=Actinomadura litoris TaxID=2678616 RepID=A0A7K1L3M1_9ACTN|nr:MULTISPECIES: NDP-hexose 2,3-dehydratase family protein [Actinomadura]MBT2210151.1 NDP-hexose 2,3-dehydratase family protein [Actinomadura sp. NEAU-AAG7]MUN39028.1 NDP-hexose 2,3-dehydratase [Actinomadura litoris]